VRVKELIGNENKFPRKLADREKDFLFSILPEKKPGYKKYRDKIDGLYVIGTGRFGETNLILGNQNENPDFSYSSTPVFALGAIIYSRRDIPEESVVDVIIHEENDNQIEFDISCKEDATIPEALSEINRWNFSEWIPGDKAPVDKSFVREVILIPGKYIVAIAPSLYKIWLHEFESGVNHLIPLTNFYNYLMIVTNIRDPKKILKQKLLFENLSDYTDKDLIATFILYNKYFKRFLIDFPIQTEREKEKKIPS